MFIKHVYPFQYWIIKHIHANSEKHLLTLSYVSSYLAASISTTRTGRVVMKFDNGTFYKIWQETSKFG
jgi:hypothetical protein